MIPEDDININELIDDTDGIVDIPLDIIETESKNDSGDIVDRLLDNYKDIIFEHPDLRKNIEVEKEGLRVLLKMKKTNEVLHDILVKSIGSNSNNASLYMSYTRMQGTILSIQKQIDEKIDNIKKLLKNYQMELNFEEEQEEDVQIEQVSTGIRSCGMKDFIKQMGGEDNHTGTQLSLDISENN